MDMCCYGCGLEAVYTFKNGKRCCSLVKSKCPVHRNKTINSNKSRPKVKDRKYSTKPCPCCSKDVPTNNFNKHVKWCEGNGKDRRECEVCGKTFHSWGAKTCSTECFKTLLSAKATLSMTEAYATGTRLPYGGAGARSVVNTKLHGQITVLSSYEVEVCGILDDWHDRGIIKHWDYTPDRFKYLDECGKQRTYFPDFKITENDGSFYYLETKGFMQIRDQYKWDAVKQQGYSLDVWFLDNIRQHKNNKD